MTTDPHFTLHTHQSGFSGSGAFRGRVARSEQVRVAISLPDHKPWARPFFDWSGYGFRNWLRRSAPTCEVGPKPYAIAGPDGNGLGDSRSEALLLRCFRD